MAHDPIIRLAGGIGLVQIEPGIPQPVDSLCPYCLNPALFDVNIYGYGNDPTRARLLWRQRLCVDCERPITRAER